MRLLIITILLLALPAYGSEAEKIEDVLKLCDVLSGGGGGTDTGTFNGRCILENQEKVALLLKRIRPEIDPDQTTYEKFISQWNDSAKKRCSKKNAWCLQGAMCGHLDLACALQSDIELLQKLSCKAISKKAVPQVSPKLRGQLARNCVAEGFRY